MSLLLNVANRLRVDPVSRRDPAMLEFFRGWKRKVGCVTLAMACVFAAGWLKSLTRFDFFTRSSERTTFRVGTVGGELKLMIQSPPTKSTVAWSFGDLNTIVGYRIQADGQRETLDRWRGYDVKWRWDFAGLHFGAGDKVKILPHYSAQIFSIAYPWIVIPLTLLSAWLLLSKPRTKAIDASAEKPRVESLS